LARRPAAAARNLHCLDGRELRPWQEPVRVPRSEPRGDATFHPCRRSQSAGLRACGLDRPRNRRTQPATIPCASPVRASHRERRHSFLGTVTYPITAARELTAIGRVTSGARFTPLVGSDINGDGARNDRALVFDPAAAPDTAVANGMWALLATASPRVRDCLQSQLGRVAARNSCAGPWQPSLDLQINWRPAY